MGVITGICCKPGVIHNFAVVLVLSVFLQSNIANARNEALIELHEENWREMLRGEWMIEFFAPWCPACKSLSPTWQRFAETISESGVSVAKIDVTTSPSLSGRFFVTALPTIYHVKDGEFRQYRGSRDGDALIQYIKMKHWQSAEPISAWKKPDTIHMSILSFFFKLSHSLKDFNARLQEEYGLPSWGSYALFAVGTVFVGAALGLVLVCVVDFLYPPKRTPRQTFAEAKEKVLDKGVEDLAQFDLEDEAESQKEDKAEQTQNEEEAKNKSLKGATVLNNSSETDSSESDSTNNEKSSAENESSEIDENVKVESEVLEGEAEVTSLPTDVRKRKSRKAD